MSEIDRIIGRLETGFESLAARLKKIEKKLDKLDEEYNQRRGVSRFFAILFGVMGGAFTHIVTKIIDN